MLHNKHFTIEEAQTELVAIAPKIRQIAELKKTIDEKGYNLYRNYVPGAPTNGEKYSPEEETLIALLKELNNRGVQMKEMDIGLIDFPFIDRDGAEVYLCWQIGEEKIEYWHHISDGFKGRRPLSELI